MNVLVSKVAVSAKGTFCSIDFSHCAYIILSDEGFYTCPTHSCTFEFGTIQMV